MDFSLVSRSLTKVFGSRNDRLLKAYRRRVDQINALEPDVLRLTDEELKAKTAQFQERLKNGERMSAIMPEVMAVAREGMDRAVGIRNIFNPEAGFDASQLPDDLRPRYEETVQRAAAIAPLEVLGGAAPIPGWQQVDIPHGIYAAVRKLYPLSRPPFRARPFDVQLIGGMVLGEGRIAEMKTGEGKTIVAPLACYVACVEGLQCYVVTVNDYLVQRDRDWVFPFYHHLGLAVGAIHPFHMQTGEEKQKAYHCNVVYGTNSEFGFDYLRDNMKLSSEEQVQKHRDFCIIDEVDSILIDEARTPLIISGPAHEDAPRYGMADDIARHLIQKQREWDGADVKVQQTLMRIKGLEGDIRNARDKEKIPPMREEMKRLQQAQPELEAVRDRITRYYELEMEKKAAHLTNEGVAEAQKKAGIGSFYVGENMEFAHLLENALRAHAVYQLDKDYVVQNGEVVIVDEFTGRLMIGRQWSDGLHQAVEAKEKVKIKQETQTLATVTIQNYFKLFKRLAGMTGTAITESTEFNEIYGLDVVCIPTNVPVIRDDRNDLVYLSEKDKWEAILDEIKRMHDVGRPVLVGTTSVEKSQMLSGMLTRKYGIKHEVLNAKQHEREAQIVLHAGELGAVMIATNMAGRGTDIKLAAVPREGEVRHWQLRNLLPRDAKPDMADNELVAMVYRHIAKSILGLKQPEIDTLDDQQLRLSLLRQWVVQNTFTEADKAEKLTDQECIDRLNREAPGFLLHRLEMYEHVEEMGGLHIIGTERHEARRIDNQLRGRAGRQGDRGSSRFFISLEDDLMKLFAGKTTLTLLSKLGMKEGDAIEHSMITGAVQRAQRKVEERNYEIRKNLLEYDEVMEHQRNAFYGMRQHVLDGQGIDQIIFDYIAEAVEDAVATYLDKDYVPTQIAEWCRQQLDVAIETYKLRSDDLHDLQDKIHQAAQDEVRQTVDLSLVEYMSNDLPPEEWDLKALSSWAMSRFGVSLTQTQLRNMNVDDVKSRLTEAALVQLETKDLSGVEKFLEPLYAQRGLTEWARNQFGVEIDPQKIAEIQGHGGAGVKDEVIDLILDKAQAAYHQREINYPVEFMLGLVFDAAQQQNGPWAAQQLAGWSNQRYEMGWTPDQVGKIAANELRTALTEAATAWHDGPKMGELVDREMAKHPDPVDLAAWASQRFGQKVEPQELADPAKRKEVLVAKGKAMLRTEVTQLERYILLQIIDMAWKDHLYAMDQLKDSVHLRGYAEQDPRIEYKREGSSLFTEMQRGVRDRVTELIFKARLTANVQMRNVYGSQQTQHVDAAAVAARGTAQQREDLAAAQQAGGEEGVHMSRKARRAAAAQGESAADSPKQSGDHDRGQQFKERRRRR